MPVYQPLLIAWAVFFTRINKIVIIITITIIIIIIIIMLSHETNCVTPYSKQQKLLTNKAKNEKENSNNYSEWWNNYQWLFWNLT